MSDEMVVRISGLRIDVADSRADIVDEVNLALRPGEVLGLVGESGSGKTTVGLAVLGHARRRSPGRWPHHRGRHGGAGPRRPPTA